MAALRPSSVFVGLCAALALVLVFASDRGEAFAVGRRSDPLDDEQLLLKLLAMEERLKNDEKLFDRLLAEMRQGLGSYVEGRDDAESIRFTKRFFAPAADRTQR